MDTYYYKKEHWTSLSADSREATPMVMKGTINFVYLLGVVLAVAFVNEGTIKQMGEADARSAGSGFCERRNHQADG